MDYIKTRKHAPRSLQAHSALAAATLITGLTLAFPAAAQSAGDGNSPAQGKALDKISVEGADDAESYKVEQLSSSKFTQPILDTPQTVQVISSGLFTEQGATSLTEALRNTPGVGTFYVGENGNTSTGDTLYMRGFDTSSSIFVDGVRDLGSISRDVFNVEQIEVQKGPAGTDNGRSAPTGAINLVTKRAIAQDVTTAALSGGIDGQKRVTADWNQTLPGDGAVRLNGLWQDSDVVGRDHVKNKRWGIAPSLAYGLGSSTRYYLNLLYVKQDNIPDGGVSTIGLPGYTSPDVNRPFITNAPTVDPDNFYGTRADHDDVTAKMATFVIEHDFSDTLKLTNTARWGKNKQDYLLTSYMASAANLLTPNPADPSTWTVARSTPTFKNQENQIATDQLNLRIDFATGAIQHNLSTGVEFAEEKLDARGVAVTGGTRWPAANVYDPNWDVTGLTYAFNGADRHGKTTTTSGYAFDTLKFGQKFFVTGGIRLDDYKTEYDALALCGGNNAPACAGNPTGTVLPSVDLEKSDTLFNWKLGAVYKVVENVSLYANYAISQQPPGGSTFELSAASNNANNPAFDPQKAKTKEIGVKWDAVEQKLLVTAALFDTDVTNEITQGDDGLFYQTGKKSVKGVELAVVGNLTDSWAISSGYTKLDTKVDAGTLVAQDRTNNLTYTPDQAFTLWSTYRLPFNLSIGGGVRYSGEMHRGTDGAIGTPAFTNSYTVWDAVATYPVNANLNLRLNAYNLTDKDYVSAINKSGYRYTPGVPRTLLLSADLRF
jgi:catecholate siderophore receptor